MNTRSALMRCLLFSLALLHSNYGYSESDLARNITNLPLPVGASIEWVSDSVFHNDTPLSIASYVSPLSHQETLKFYRKVWPDQFDPFIPGFIETSLGNWIFISRFRENINTVVQLDLASIEQSVGFVSVVDVSGQWKNTSRKNPIPGIQLISKTASEKEHSLEVIWVYQSNHTPSGMSDFLLREYQGKGWNHLSSRRYEDSHLIKLERRDWSNISRIELIVTRGENGNSLAVVSEVVNEN